MSRPLLLAIAGSLRSTNRIFFVGACTPQSGTTASTTVVLGLPAAAQAGDTLLAQLTYAAVSSPPPSSSGPTGSIAAIHDQTFKWFGSDIAWVAVYTLKLASADITAGTVTFGVSPSSFVAGRGTVWRNVSDTLLDGAASVATNGSTVTSPATLTAPAFSTALDGDMIVSGATVAIIGSSDAALTVPSGYSVADVGGSGYYGQMVYAPQSAHGSVGSVSSTFTQTSTNEFGWAAWTLALRVKKPAITFSTTLPQPQVGVAYTGSITATNVDGATGAITLTPTGLPAGLSLGTRTGSGPYTWPVTGTPTTAGAFSASFAATNGTQSASYAWSGSVNAGGITITGSSTFYGNLFSTLPVPAGAAAGDLMVIAGFATSNSVGITPPTGSTQFYSQIFGPSGQRNAHAWGYFLTATDITNGHVSFTTTTSYNMGGVIGTYRGVHASMTDVIGTPGSSSVAANPIPISAPGITTTAPNDLILFHGAAFSGGAKVGTFTVATGFTDQIDQLNVGSLSNTLQTMAAPTAGAIGAASSTFSNTNAGTYCGILIALKAA